MHTRIMHLFMAVLLIGSFLPCDAFALDKAFASSPFSTLSPSDLSGDSIKSESISSSGIPSAMGAQTFFFIPASPSAIAHKLLSWDTSSYKDLGIIKHSSFKTPATKATFSELSLDKENSQDQWFVEASGKIKDLHISSQDISILKTTATKQSASATTDTWRQILANKTASFSSGGSESLTPYQLGNSTFSPTSELKKLIRKNPSIATSFQSIIEATFSGSSDIGETSFYWEKLKIDRQTVLNLGITKTISTQDTWQVADYQYYVSSNYYTSLILYQIAPATVGGKQGSFIWRADLILTPGMENARGVERVFGAKVLIREISKSIEYLRREISKQ